MPEQDEASPIAVGLVGLGRAGWHLHAEAVAHHAALFELDAVADPFPGRAEQSAHERGCRWYADHRPLLESPDVELVVICAPTTLHCRLAVEALDAGKHVLVEKPVAISLAEIDEMVGAARRNGRRLLASQNRRYTADFLELTRVLDSGVLGEVHEIRINWQSFKRRWDWQALAEQGGGALLNDGSHIVDQALVLLGDAEPDVWHWRHRTPLAAGTAEDHLKILLTAPDQPVLDLEINYACALPQPTWQVLGSAGALIGTDDYLKWKYVDPDTVQPRTAVPESPADRGYHREDFGWTEREWSAPERYVESHHRMYLDVHTAIRQNVATHLDAALVRSQVSVLDRCRGPLSGSST